MRNPLQPFAAQFLYLVVLTLTAPETSAAERGEPPFEVIIVSDAAGPASAYSTNVNATRDPEKPDYTFVSEYGALIPQESADFVHPSTIPVEVKYGWCQDAGTVREPEGTEYASAGFWPLVCSPTRLCRPSVVNPLGPRMDGYPFF